jgi:hypothetical protein
MNIILLEGDWTQTNPNLTSYEIGIRYDKKAVSYEVKDEHLFFLSVLKYGIAYKVVKRYDGT